ncbi:MAG: aspartate kinase [Bacteroidales bacterium]|nr:aspartate kinase [Bacteroidales bacterium]
MIVMKFGGTSVQDAAAIQKVIEIVRSRLDERPLVVVSAFARVTRLLVEATSSLEQEALLEAARKRHFGVCRELLSGELLARTEAQVEEILTGISGCHDEPTVISAGELMSSTIVSAAFNQAGIPCKWLDARKMVLTTGDRMSGRPDLEKTAAAVRAAASFDGLMLTQGFIATSSDGLASVLGFEGSDYSAAIFGMSLGASRVEIWTDVDGIRTADPRVVSDTCRIPRVSYDEAAEMARLGARVLHPMTIYPARMKNIPIQVLNTSNPSCEGSCVAAEVSDGPKSVALLTIRDSKEIGSKALAGENAGMSLVSVIGRNMGEREMDVMAAFGTPEVSPLSISVTVDAAAAGEIANQIHKKIFL